MADDWKLLDAWRKGDNRAGEQLVSLHFPAISRFFRGKVNADIDDLVQQTFLACMEGRDRISGSFRSYLFGVARRRLYDYLRNAYRDPSLDFSVRSLADLGTTPTEGIARDQRAVLLQTALRQLPTDAQITLELAYWEGLVDSEIAATLEIEVGTVRSRLSRARAKLREAVLALGGDASDLFGSTVK